MILRNKDLILGTWHRPMPTAMPMLMFMLVLQGFMIGAIRTWYRKTSMLTKLRMNLVYGSGTDIVVATNVLAGGVAGALMGACLPLGLTMELLLPGSIEDYHRRLTHYIKMYLVFALAVLALTSAPKLDKLQARTRRTVSSPVRRP